MTIAVPPNNDMYFHTLNSSLEIIELIRSQISLLLFEISSITKWLFLFDSFIKHKSEFIFAYGLCSPSSINRIGQLLL